MMVGCISCINSRANNGRDEWCTYSDCLDHNMYEPVARIPTSPDQCGDMYVAECDIPDGLCLVCPCSTYPRGDEYWCPLGAGKIKEVQPEEIIVVGNRYYQPQYYESQIRLEPRRFVIEMEE